MTRLFGTDGVRGQANGVITAELALKLAQSAAKVLGRAAREANRKPTAIVARDPRISSDFIAAAVSAGLAASGVDVLDAGVIPTPATAYLIASIEADFGVMISASHNPAPDNGIKFFAAKGQKLDDALEDEIEAALQEEPLLPIGGDVGRIEVFADAEDRYSMHLLSSLNNRLDGLHVVLDCAHGAAAGVSPETFAAAGAKVDVIGNNPDGLNINDGVGSTALELLQQEVVSRKADLGIAHDGDADRCLAVDADGNIIDGDHIMAILALSMKEKDQLADNTIVSTVMSNLGLFVAMEKHDIRVERAAVGDRYVLAMMREQNLSFGGEQSGHIIMDRWATTGDGLLTGLHLMARMNETGKSLAELASIMTTYPQVLINVPHVDRSALDRNETVASRVAEIEQELGNTGRVLLRASGTEPLIRVMVEAEHIDDANRYAQEIADLVSKELQLP